jgi:hypothetical protein
MLEQLENILTQNLDIVEAKRLAVTDSRLMEEVQ